MRTVQIQNVEITVQDHRAYQYLPWEISMTSRLFPMLKPGMVVWDIGAEEAELTAAVAKIVGPENVHILEPSPKYWPNIRAIWDANGLGDPGGCFQGFVADVCRDVKFNGIWPQAIKGEIQKEGAFCFVDERPDIPAITIDEYARVKGKPDVILMDIEGAEVLALRGARETLKHATLFVSVHNETALAKYGTTREELFELIPGAEYLGYDHEAHYCYRP